MRIFECGQRTALALRSAGENDGAHRHRHADADRLHVRLDELHRVVDREPGVHDAARRVDVDRDVLVGILRLEMEELRDDEVRDLVVDRRSEEDDALVEQARVDVERALAARGLLDDHRNQGAHALSLLPGVHNFVSPSGFSLSGVQSLSRASASSGAIGLTSATRRSSAARRRRSSRIDSCWPCAQTSSMTPSTSVFAGGCGLLADVGLHVVVRDVDPGLLGERLERELARDRHGGLEHHLPLELLCAAAARREVGVERDAAALERAREAREQIAGTGTHERERGLHLRGADELVDGGDPERGVDLGVELLAQRRLDARAQLGERVELARGSVRARRRARAAPSPAPRGPSPRRSSSSRRRAGTRSASSRRRMRRRGRPRARTRASRLRARRRCRAAPLRRSRRGRRRACRPRAPADHPRVQARRLPHAAPRSRRRPTPAGPRPRRGAPRASSSRRARGAPAPRPSRRSSRSRPPCPAARTRTAGRRPGARGCATRRSRTSRRCGCRRPRRRCAPCRAATRARASGSSPCGSRGSSRSRRGPTWRDRWRGGPDPAKRRPSGARGSRRGSRRPWALGHSTSPG